MDWKPNKWAALALSIATSPLGLLYAGAPKATALYFATMVPLAVCGFMHIPAGWPPAAFAMAQLSCGIVAIVLSYRYAARATPISPRPWYTRWYSLLGFACVALLATCFTRAFFYEPFHIPSASMAPTLERGANVMVDKWGYGHYSTYGMRLGSRPISARLHRGDIIVFDYPKDPSLPYIQRLVGLPGDTVEIRSGQLSINGKSARLRRVEDYLERGSDSPALAPRYTERLDGMEYDVIMAGGEPEYPEAGPFPLRERCKFGPGVVSCVIPPGHYFVLGDNRNNSADSRLWGFVRADQVVGKLVGVFGP